MIYLVPHNIVKNNTIFLKYEYERKFTENLKLHTHLSQFSKFGEALGPIPVKNEIHAR